MKTMHCAHALLMTPLINSCKHVILVLSHRIQIDLRQKFNVFFLLIYFHERHNSRREKQDTNVNEDVSQTPSNYLPVFNGIVYLLVNITYIHMEFSIYFILYAFNE